MRRFFLILTICIAGSSQPAQLQAQPPIPVRIEMPTESILIMLLKVVLPTILGAALGAGITLYGLRQNNKHNAAENKANREHQLQVEIAKAEIAAKYRSQDNRWAFRKDVYVNLITTISGLIGACSDVATNMTRFHQLKQELTPLTDPRMTAVLEGLKTNIDDQIAHGNVFATYVSLSPLAIAEDVVPLVTSTWEKFEDLDLSTPELIAANMPEKQKTLGELLRKLQAAARKDLWGTPETEAKTGATT
jgi:hypothetical protein